MAYLPLDIPSGVFNHGTELESAGRWRDVNLVRWQNNSLRPIGGWNTRVSAAASGAPRGAISWSTNSGDSWIGFGNYQALYAVSSSGTVTNITPTGFTTGYEDAVELIGYGNKAYGTSSYGVARPTNGVFQSCTSWSLDNWGEYLIGCSSDDGKIYEWQLNVANPAAVVTNAPVNNSAIMVTAERFLFALGAGGNPRKVAWSDRENNTDWTATSLNEAGDIELQTSGKIMCGLQIRGRALIITNTDAHVATYQGPPYVYGFERAGTACGTISRMSAAAVDTGAFWMGSNGFFMYNGSTVQEMPCDVADYVFSNISATQKSKVFAVHNSSFGEVWWFYPSGSSLENDRYVVYDYKENHWNIGTLSRTAGIDYGVFTKPIWFDASANIYNQETGMNHGGVKPYAETGPISLGAGDNVMRVTGLVSDELTFGEATFTFKTRFHPNDTERTYGPYSVANPKGVRMTGRQVRVKIEGDDLKDWRVGKQRLSVVQGGKR